MKEDCDCQDCKNKRAYRLEGMEIFKAKIDEAFGKHLYAMGIPKDKIRQCYEAARSEIK